MRRNEKSAEELQEALENEFYIWVKHIEEQKLLYFALTYTGRTLLITAPSDTDEQKRFLGYEFSTRRGKEGIIEAEGYLTNMHDRNDRNKLAWFVKAAFDGIQCESEPYRKYVSYIRTADLLDFSRPSLDLQLKLTADKTIEISSKYPLVRLEEIVDPLGGLWTGKKPPFKLVKVIRNTNFTMNGELNLDNVAEIQVEENAFIKRKLPKGAIILEKSGGSNTQAVGRVVLFNIDSTVDYAYSNFTARLRLISNDFLSEFLHLYLNNLYLRGHTFDFQTGSSGLKNLDLNRYLSIQVPCPSIPIQQQIVAECEKVDEEYNTSRMTIEGYKKKIAQVFERLDVITNVGGG